MTADADAASPFSELVGARIDGVTFDPTTGLLALSVYAGHTLALVIGLGPRALGIGLCDRAPRPGAPSTHPVVAAVRAHLVGHRVRAVTIDDEERLWVVSGGEQQHSRMGIWPGRSGEVLVVDVNGSHVLRWPSRGATAVESGWFEAMGDPHASGTRMLERAENWRRIRLRATLEQGISRVLRTLHRRAEAVRDDLSRLEQVEPLQRIGRLLVAQSRAVPRGATRAVLEDWDHGGTVTVTLNPARGAHEQAEEMFARARRLQRGERTMRERLARTEAELATLTGLRDELAALPEEVPEETLAALSVRARTLGVRDKSANVGASGERRVGKAAPERLPYRVFRSAGGESILVGRGARDNDALTLRHARPHDLWLHAQGVAGAHVVVPLTKGKSCPPELLVDAATLAVHFSDARTEARADVAYAPRLRVRKPRGSAPGRVVIDRETVLRVVMQRARLDRLLATLED